MTLWNRRASNEDLMMLEYEGGNGTHWVCWRQWCWLIFQNHRQITWYERCRHVVQICYRKRIRMDSILCFHSQIWYWLNASIIFWTKMSYSLDYKRLSLFAGLELMRWWWKENFYYYSNTSYWFSSHLLVLATTNHSINYDEGQI